MRIVSLAHFATETLHLLEIQRKNTVLWAEAPNPPPGDTAAQSQRLPTNPTGPKTPEISPATPDCPDLAAFEPTLIIFDPRQTDHYTLEKQVESLPHRPDLLSLSPRTIEDMLDNVLTIGNAIGNAALARERVVSLRARLWHAQERVNAYTTGPVVAAVLGITPPPQPPTTQYEPNLEAGEAGGKANPIIIAGDWIVQMIERAGAEHPLNPGIPSPTAGAASGPQMAALIPGPARCVSLRAFADTMPEILLLAQPSLPTATQPPEAELQQALSKALSETTWNQIPAVRTGRIIPIELAIPWPMPTPTPTPTPTPSPSLVETFEQLVEVVRAIS